MVTVQQEKDYVIRATPGALEKVGMRLDGWC